MLGIDFRNNKHMKEINAITQKIIGCCFRVHTALGPGFQEKIYHTALCQAFDKEGLVYETQKRYSVSFDSKRVGYFTVDLVVDDLVIVEIKAVCGTMPVLFKKQILSYLKAARKHIGLLINFGNESC